MAERVLATAGTPQSLIAAKACRRRLTAASNVDVQGKAEGKAD